MKSKRKFLGVYEGGYHNVPKIEEITFCYENLKGNIVYEVFLLGDDNQSYKPAISGAKIDGNDIDRLNIKRNISPLNKEIAFNRIKEWLELHNGYAGTAIGTRNMLDNKIELMLSSKET